MKILFVARNHTRKLDIWNSGNSETSNQKISCYFVTFLSSNGRQCRNLNIPHSAGDPSLIFIQWHCKIRTRLLRKGCKNNQNSTDLGGGNKLDKTYTCSLKTKQTNGFPPCSTSQALLSCPFPSPAAYLQVPEWPPPPWWQWGAAAPHWRSVGTAGRRPAARPMRPSR